MSKSYNIRYSTSYVSLWICFCQGLWDLRVFCIFKSIFFKARLTQLMIGLLLPEIKQNKIFKTKIFSRLQLLLNIDAKFLTLVFWHFFFKPYSLTPSPCLSAKRKFSFKLVLCCNIFGLFIKFIYNVFLLCQLDTFDLVNKFIHVIFQLCQFDTFQTVDKLMQQFDMSV